jgi:hypothetical protein
MQKSISDFIRKNHNIDYTEIKKSYTPENFTKKFIEILKKA